MRLQGARDTKEAEEIRGEMDVLWRELTPAEQCRVAEFSEKLWQAKELTKKLWKAKE